MDRKTISLEVAYLPEQGVSYGGRFTAQGILGHPDQVVTVAVGAFDQPLGEVDYSFDTWLPGIEQPGRATVAAYSKFEPRRIVKNKKIDERRSGGAASLEAPLITSLAGQSVYTRVSGSVEQADFSGEGAPEDGGRWRMDCTMAWQVEGPALAYGNTAWVAPSAGAGSTFDGDAYVTAGAEAGGHWLLDHFFEADFHGGLTWMSDAAPADLLPTVGGEGSVRGFRADEAVGEVAAYLQSEIWIPLRGFTNLPDPLGATLRTKCFVAPFVDAGVVHGGSGERTDGFLLGAGVGLRVRMSDFVIRIDCAYGAVNTASGDTGAQFYFSVDRPFTF